MIAPVGEKLGFRVSIFQNQKSGLLCHGKIFAYLL